MQDCTWKYQSKRTIFAPLGLASTVFAACQRRVSYSTRGHRYLCAAREGNKTLPRVCCLSLSQGCAPASDTSYLLFRKDWSDVPAVCPPSSSLKRGHVPYMYIYRCAHVQINTYTPWTPVPCSCTCPAWEKQGSALGKLKMKERESRGIFGRGRQFEQAQSLWKGRISGSRKHCCFRMWFYSECLST